MGRYLALVLLLIGLPVTACAQAGHGIAAPPDTGSNVLRRARELRARHDPARASALLESYLAGHAEDAEALTLLAQIREDAGDTKTAQILLVQALNASPNSPSANRLAGTMLLSAQQYPEAMDRFETVLVALPHDADTRRLELKAATELAARARAAGNEEAALAVLEHVRRTIPDNPDLLRDLGMEASNLHRYAEAEEALNAARQLDPKASDILYALARVELEQQHMEAAESHMRSYLAERPNDASAHYGLGHILALEQKDDAARAQFDHSVRLQPIQTESYYEIGQLDLNAHRDQQAQTMFRKVIDRDPNHGGALVGLGEIALRAKLYTDAEAYLQRAKKAAPAYAPAHYYLGLALARLGRKAESDEELKWATQLGHDAALPVQLVPPGSQP